jgi:hypothetical protein
MSSPSSNSLPHRSWSPATVDEPRVLPRADVAARPTAALEQPVVLTVPLRWSQHARDSRIASMISNGTGRPVFCWITVARVRSAPPGASSLTLSSTRSLPLSLALIAQLKRARFRASGLKLPTDTPDVFGLEGRLGAENAPRIPGTTRGSKEVELGHGPAPRMAVPHQSACHTAVGVLFGRAVEDGVAPGPHIGVLPRGGRLPARSQSRLSRQALPRKRSLGPVDKVDSQIR